MGFTPLSDGKWHQHETYERYFAKSLYEHVAQKNYSFT